MTPGGDRDLRVYRGGVIGRADTAAVGTNQSSAGQQDHEGRARSQEAAGLGEGGSQARSGQGAASGEGSSASAAPLFSGEGLTAALTARLEELAVEYPQVRIRPVPPEVWVFTRMAPVPWLEEAYLASLLSPYATAPPWVRTWSWWDDGVWIGPRHTNYPDGSICAFEIADATWEKNDSLVALWDLYSLWIVRHLHLRHHGYWPGEQVLHTAHERLEEQEPQELCGGCRSFRAYGDCHRPADLRINPVRRLARRALSGTLGRRGPPPAVTGFLSGGLSSPPSWSEIDAWCARAQGAAT